MTVPRETDSRSDRAVILARGLGVRMGGLKGLLKLPGTGRAFVRIIADLYLGRGIPVDVVVPDRHREAHAAELPTREDCRILPAGPGGDTALTMLESWRVCRSAGPTCSHFWAHPVDLPLVTPETIETVRDASRKNPSRILRPVREGIPGHPVILPYDVLAALAERTAWHRRPLRDFLRKLRAEDLFPSPLEVEVADRGVDRDFDRPDDLIADP